MIPNQRRKERKGDTASLCLTTFQRHTLLITAYSPFRERDNQFLKGLKNKVSGFI